MSSIAHFRIAYELLCVHLCVRLPISVQITNTKTRASNLLFVITISRQFSIFRYTNLSQLCQADVRRNVGCKNDEHFRFSFFLLKIYVIFS